MKILHITNWYPDQDDPLHAVWLRRLIISLNPHCQQTIYHIESKKGWFILKSNYNADGSYNISISLPFTVWKINEIVSSFIIVWIVFIRERKSKFDLINFHIAYPNCTYLHIYRKWLKCSISISEHWSGYHFNFNIRKPEKRKRIQRIFRQKIPVMAVSKALLKDIKTFSQADFPGYVVPNVVDTSIFNYKGEIQSQEGLLFFMLSQWKWPKDPFTILKAWEKVIRIYPQAILRIGGYGAQYNDISNLIRVLRLEEKVKLLGQLTPIQSAAEMQHATAFIHCSKYETFSVVCAEALCCGTPVIASRVGGIPEYIREKDGLLVPENTPEAFYLHIMQFLYKQEIFDRPEISRTMIDRFAENKVGKLYYSAITEIISHWNYGTNKY